MPFIVLLLIAMTLAPLCADDKVVAKIVSPHFEIRVSDEFYTQILVDDRPLSPFEPSEYLRLPGEDNEMTEFQVTRVSSESVTDELGSGQQTTILGTNANIQKVCKITVYPAYPKVATFRVSYQNLGQKNLPIAEWVSNGYRVPFQGDSNALWSFQGGSYEDRYDWVRPLTVGEGEDNFQGMNASDYGGGVPLSSLWTTDYGIAVGVLDELPTTLALPVDRDGESFGLEITGRVDKALESGEILQTNRTFVCLHEGDFYNALLPFRSMMEKLGYKPPEFPSTSYEPIWCGWGYEREVTLKQMLGTLDKAKELGFQWAVLDDGWQTNEGDWELDPEKFPNGSASMRGFTQSVKEKGLKPKLWWAPLAADPDSELARANPEYLLLNKDGSPREITWWDAYYLCPDYPPVHEYTRKLVVQMLQDWDFEGLKIDGQHLNAAPPCYNSAHGHLSPQDSTRAMSKFLQLVYETAQKQKPQSVVEVCPCGTTYAFHSLPYTNQPVSSDPESSFQIRLKAKTLKALMGTDLPYYGDHVELSSGGEDFASTVGVGGVIGSKFTLPDLSTTTSKYDLSPAKEMKWSLWSEIYLKKMLPKGSYRGELYDIAFDKPETHAIEKDGSMHYAFYAEDFHGSVSLRGLSPDEYQVWDYVRGTDLGKVRGPEASLEVKFQGYLLIEARKAP